ncbi:hypothetical protein HNR16_002887 [Pseudoclavibacter chungangensis]|nr:hypothetical protein [Pseudoclavibacter chungangensis]
MRAADGGGAHLRSVVVVVGTRLRTAAVVVAGTSGYGP